MPTDVIANPNPARAQRFFSIDVLRGITVGFMILVNNNGNNDLAYRALNHSPWNGFTPTDAVFPAFLFLLGISTTLSYRARIARGQTRAEILAHAIRRFALLSFLGLVVNGFPYFHLSTLRIYGVLQRIAVCSILASLLLMVTERIWVMVSICIALLVGYWILLRWVPVPGHGLPVQDFSLLDPNINLAAWLDRHIFPHRLFEGTRDPEGLLSDLPSFATTLLGMIATVWLRAKTSASAKAFTFAGVGLLLLIAGFAWSPWFPINKKLWTSSYVLFAGGWSFLALAIVFWVVEVRAWRGRWTMVPLVFGTNAITAYVFSELLSSAVADFHVNPRQSIQQWSYSVLFKPILSPAFGSLVYSLVFVLVCFVPAWLLYRKKIFLKV